MYYTYSRMTSNITNLDMNCTGAGDTLVLGINCHSYSNTYNTSILEGLNFKIQFNNQTNDNYLILPLMSLASDPSTQGLGVYMTEGYLDNTIIVGAPFYDAFLAQFYIVDIGVISNNWMQLYVNYFSEYDAYIGNATIIASASNPFIYTPIVAPPAPKEKANLGLILGLVGGAIVLVVIAFGVYIWKCRKPKE
jgi:hypothetical protein